MMRAQADGNRPTREAIIDLDALRHNVRRLRELTGVAELIVVVKANAYGHGAVAVARAAIEAGADRLGVADISEGVALRAAGITAPVLAWLHGPDADFGAALLAGLELALSSEAQLEQVLAAAAVTDSGVPVVQFKLETGLSRNGAAEEDWPALFAAAAAAEHTGLVRVDGLFSHVSNTSSADDARAAVRFERGVELAKAAGLAPAPSTSRRPPPRSASQRSDTTPSGSGSRSTASHRSSPMRRPTAPQRRLASARS